MTGVGTVGEGTITSQCQSHSSSLQEFAQLSRLSRRSRSPNIPTRSNFYSSLPRLSLSADSMYRD